MNATNRSAFVVKERSPGGARRSRPSCALRRPPWLRLKDIGVCAAAEGEEAEPCADGAKAPTHPPDERSNIRSPSFGRKRVCPSLHLLEPLSAYSITSSAPPWIDRYGRDKRLGPLAAEVTARTRRCSDPGSLPR